MGTVTESGQSDYSGNSEAGLWTERPRSTPDIPNACDRNDHTENTEVRHDGLQDVTVDTDDRNDPVPTWGTLADYAAWENNPVDEDPSGVAWVHENVGGR